MAGHRDVPARAGDAPEGTRLLSPDGREIYVIPTPEGDRWRSEDGREGGWLELCREWLGWLWRVVVEVSQAVLLDRAQQEVDAAEVEPAAEAKIEAESEDVTRRVRVRR